SAVAKSHRYYPETGASLPQVVEIRIPPAELAMTIDVGTVELNRLANNPQLWTLPTSPGSPAVDLGAAPPADPGGGVPTLGSQIHDADWYAALPPGGAPAPIGATPIGATPGAAVASGTPTPLGAPVAMNAQGGQMQFVMPGGVAAPLTTPAGAPPVSMQLPPSAAGSAQRLPSGGVAAPSFTR
ncbi:MAG TPA: hypothetical protein VEQ85_03650, partial [Lacipirellulaceae bacterium]|nr:hypothetical protein [Lacipirellulaceae bacterium]